VDGLGNKTRRRSYGRMNTTEHETILRILEKRAQRFRPELRLVDVQNEWGYQIDDTGTLEVEEENADIVRERELEASRVEMQELQSINDAVLEIHGQRPMEKQDGVIRLVYENVNGIDSRFKDNWKVDKAKDLHDELAVDIAAYNEHKINMKHKQNKVGFNQLFWGGEAEVRSVVAHNVHEVGHQRVQEGGTSMLMFGGIIDYLDMASSGRDETGLGRWVVMTLRGDTNTRIVCGYNPCGNDKPNSGTVYHQHRRYWLGKRRCATCPRVKFRDDLISQLKRWREEGDKLIVCLDANENVYKKAIGKALTSVDGLAMKEVVGDFTGTPIGPTYFRGSKPIDAVWATSDVDVVGACIMPAGYGIGDHRLFVVDFLASSLLGTTPKKIVRPQARRLNCKIPGAVRKYNERFEKKIKKHRLIERVGNVHQAEVPAEEKKIRLDRIDAEGKMYMKNAEKKCRKFKSGRIPFSPEAAKWIRRVQVYKSLLKFVQYGRGNHGNLRRTAYRAGITSPFQLREEDIRARIKVGKEHCDYYRRNGRQYRARHLQDRLAVAQEEENAEAERQILGIIKREKERAFWRRLRYAMASKSGGSVRSVQVEDAEGNIEVFSSQDEVHEAIWSNIHRKRFYLAEEAPICNGRLREVFGYNADSIAGDEVLEGTYWYEPDFDESTREICDELTAIRDLILADSVSDIIRRGEWGNFWARAREETSSSESGLHFSHYKAGAVSPLISHYHSVKASVTLKTGYGLERWSRGMSVMLEKVPGCQLISKLRSILLMEADFNCGNKIIYGTRMLNNVRKYGLMPDEVFSECNRTADEGSLSKVLFYDISCQTRLSAGISSVDADNCYDRVSHAIALLVFRSCGVSKDATGAMLKSIQEMKFFLRTAFGDSADFAGSMLEVKTQGLCQGNGAAPAGWAVVSIAILNAHKRKGHGAQFLCPISLVRSDLAAVLYVDDTDVIHLNMNRQEDEFEALHGLQQSVTSWGNLLIATGGSLKPSKCFYHLISYSWKPDGTWVYDDNEEREDLPLEIPLPDSTSAPIEHCGVHEAHKTLGVMTCPSGDHTAAITAMKEKAQGWIDRAISAKLA
jgi:exonuclease III